MDKFNNSETGCCPRFNPEPWDEKEITFDNKLFVKDHIKSIFHIPMNFGKVVVRNMEKIQKANANTIDNLLIVDENSLFGADMYIAVDKDIPDSKVEKISGTFLTKAFEGEYKDMGKWIKTMNEYVKSKGKQINKMYFYYTTCPKCAKVYGKNYVVILAKV